VRGRPLFPAALTLRRREIRLKFLILGECHSGRVLSAEYADTEIVAGSGDHSLIPTTRTFRSSISGLAGGRYADLDRGAAVGALFPLLHGRADQAKAGGGPDPRQTLSRKAREIHVQDLHIDRIKMKARDFR